MHSEASIVDSAVIETESATSALATYATTLDAVPPGQQQTRISPTARGVGKANKCPTHQPRKGITRYWRATPHPIAAGACRTRWKSVSSRVRPMPSMMICRPGAISP